MDLIVYWTGEVNQSPDIDHRILKDYASAGGGGNRGSERRVHCHPDKVPSAKQFSILNGN